jgi:hypothetical protein
MENTLEITNQNDVVIENYINNHQLDFTQKKYGCSVCGEDSWCGTDGCLLDPQ